MKFHSPLALSALFTASLLLLPSLGACAKDTPMRSSSAVPASEGTLKATAGDNGNTDVTILVKHLAEPSKVQAGATTYVVWFHPARAPAQNMGVMLVDEALDGRFESSTAHTQFSVSVTPERSGTVAYPTAPPVFMSEVDLGS